MLVAFISPVTFSKILFSGVKLRAKFEVLLQKTIFVNRCYLIKTLEIRLFYRKLNSRKRLNSLSVFHRNSLKYRNDQRRKLD